MEELIKQPAHQDLRTWLQFLQLVTITAVDTNKTQWHKNSPSPLISMAFIFSASAGKKMLSERASFFVNMCNAIDNSSSCESEDDQSFMV